MCRIPRLFGGIGWHPSLALRPQWPRLESASELVREQIEACISCIQAHIQGTDMQFRQCKTQVLMLDEAE